MTELEEHMLQEQRRIDAQNYAMEEYYKELSAHENNMRDIEPKKEQFGFNNGWPDQESERVFDAAYSEWHKKLFMDAPNKPGYYRANND